MNEQFTRNSPALQVTNRDDALALRGGDQRQAHHGAQPAPHAFAPGDRERVDRLGVVPPALHGEIEILEGGLAVVTSYLNPATSRVGDGFELDRPRRAALQGVG